MIGGQGEKIPDAAHETGFVIFVDDDDQINQNSSPDSQRELDTSRSQVLLATAGFDPEDPNETRSAAGEI